MFDEAKEKLKKERKDVQGQRENLVAKYVERALLVFCEQDEEFAQAVAQSGKTFKECCTYVVNKPGQVLSDMDAYKRAAEFYFPGADIKFEMRIRVNPYEAAEDAEAEGAAETAQLPAEDSIIDITSLI